MRVLVVTVVHTPVDARIHHRQIRGLLRAGHEVVLAGPFDGFGLAVSDVAIPGLECVDLPRARGRHRLPALFAARRLVRRLRQDVDVVLLHDPELVVAVAGLRGGAPIVWDVHEDLAASLADKSWVPRPARGPVRMFAHLLERYAERSHPLLLAERSYASRFRRPHPVVLNLPWLPATTSPPETDRVVYLGRVSELRGGRELIALGKRLAAHGLTLDVIGPVDPSLAADIRAAASAGWLVAHGFLPNAEAVARLAGAMAGVSLLHDHPNYRRSLPTKVVEYQASGVPVVTTPLRLAEEMVRANDSGLVVRFGDVDAAEAAVLSLLRDPEMAARLGRNGRQAAESTWSWDRVCADFVQTLEAVAGSRSRVVSP